MPLDPHKGYRSLLKGRHSRSGSEYFITFCTELRRRGLDAQPVAVMILAEIQAMETEDVWLPRCAVVMPDHVHLLVPLSDKLSLGKAVARLKSKSAASLRVAGLRWQAGYYEHQMRPKEDRLPVFLYIYLNPYRAKLLTTRESWPWFVCGATDREWFMPMLDQGLPEPAWLADLP